jgi:hypothetical protein
MEQFLRWLATQCGVQVEPGAELQFEFSNFPTGGFGMLVLMGCALSLLVVGFLYRRDGKNLSGTQRVILGSLRGLAILAAIALLLEPNLITVKRETRPGHTILLVDTSQSMTHLDAWRREQVQPLATGWREMGVVDLAATSRIDLVRALLGHQDQALVQRLAARNQVQLYAFAGSIEQLPLQAPPSTEQPAAAAPKADGAAIAPPPRLDLALLKADGRFTNLGASLRAALDRSRTAEIAGVVILTDGRRNAGAQGAEIARLLNQRKIPHTFVLGIGDPSATQSVTLTRLDAPEKVFQKDPFEMKSHLATQGYDEQSVTVRLLRSDDQGQEQLVRSQQVTLGGELNEVTVDWKELTAEQPGKYRYRAEVQPPDGEPVQAEQHSKSVAVEVLGERTRVLLLAGGPNREFQILRNLLIRDKTIDATCWLQSADPKFPQDGNEGVTIDKLPETREEFDPYDVVLFLDANPERLTDNFCQNLRQHIIEGGCGFWWVCGEQYSLDAMRSTSRTAKLAELLPIVPDIDYAERKVVGFGNAFVRPWRYQLSPEGEDGIAAKITRILDGKDERRILWSRLPGFHFWFPVQRLKPVAVCAVEHTDPELKREGRGMPVIALQNVGAGRVLFSGSDETYRWRSSYEEAYNRFWVNGIRHLFEGRLHAGNSRLRLLVNNDKIDLGEAIEFTADVKDEALQPLLTDGYEIALERSGEPSENLTLVAVEGIPGRFQLQYRPTQLGNYRIRPLQKIGKPIEINFQVIAAQIERQGPMDRAELAAITAATGGELLDTPAQLLAALERIPSRTAIDTFRTPHAIWDGWLTIAFILVVLSLEWLLRKRFNLL